MRYLTVTLLVKGDLLMKFAKIFKNEQKNFELFSKRVDQNIKRSQRKQQMMQDKNSEFSKRVQQSMLNHSK